MSAADDKGALELKIRDVLGNARDHRFWLSSRDTVGDVTFSCRAHPREITSTTKVCPREDLRSDQGGLIGCGGAFLPLPPNNEIIYQISLLWDLERAPVGTTAVWTYGEGASAYRTGSVRDLQGEYFAIGPLYKYTDRSALPNFGVYWFGTPPFHVKEISKSFQSALLQAADFFQDGRDLTFKVFIRKATNRSFGGTSLGKSFLLEYDDQYNNFIKISDSFLMSMWIHEMVHTWPGMEVYNGLIVDEVPWFNEGIATYYQAVLPYRFGLVTKTHFLDEINKVASAYYTSPVVYLSDEVVLKNFLSGFHPNRLPYYRSAIYFFKLDAQLRASSRGQYSLTEPILAFLQLKKDRKPFTLEKWLSLIVKELGSNALKDFESMQAGNLVIPPSDCLASEGFELVRMDQEIFELGFNEESLDEQEISGLIPGSRAALSGLKDGDAFEAATPPWQTADVFKQNMVVRVKKGEELIDHTFWPRGWKTVESYQWVLKD